MSNRWIRLLTAVAVPIAGVCVVASPASAATVKAQGTVTCSYATTIHFSPPLTPGIGTVVPKGASEIITMDPATLGSCTGSASVGSIPLSGVGMKPTVVKLKASVLSKVLYAGGCDFFPQFGFPRQKGIFAWTASVGALSPTKARLTGSSLIDNGLGNRGYTFTGSAAGGSFTGPVSIGAYFDAASSSAVDDCIANRGGGIASVTVDPSVSSISLG